MTRSTIGTDPEFFLKRKDGKLVAAIPFVKGTKDEPEMLKSGKGNVQKDNVALEFATNPASTMAEFVENIKASFSDIAEFLPDGHDLEVVPSADFDPDQLTHPDACMFGCDPDFNAWTVAMNEKPYCENQNFRSCGGHIHLGYVKGDGNEFLLEFDGKIITTKMMDAFHGVISTLLDSSEAAVARRELYGKAGCHRPTDYGVEYRVLSNYWLKSPQLVMLMDSLSQDILRIIREKKAEEIIDAIGDSEIQNIINDGKVEEAKKALDTVLRGHMSEDSLHYLEECLENADKFDFKKEWGLERSA